MSDSTDRRAALLALAEDFNAKKLELLAIVREMNTLVCTLIAAGDALKLPALDARADEHAATITPLTYDAKPAVGPVAQPPLPTLPTHKRACSICGKPGHRRTTCPQANADYQRRRKDS